MKTEITVVGCEKERRQCGPFASYLTAFRSYT